MRFILTLILSFSTLGADVALSVRGHEQPSPNLELMGHGRGVAVSKKHVLTARHVLTTSDESNFRTPQVMVKGKWMSGKVVGHDSHNDIALIELPEDCLKPVDVLRIPELEVQGSPGLADPKHRKVTIQAFKTYVEEVKDLALPQDAGGLSGSPMMADDHLIGIVSSAGRDSGGIFIVVIGPEPIRKLLENHIKNDTKE